MKPTQHNLIMSYVRANGSIIPARLSDSQRAFNGQWIGAEAGRRCRELVEKGLLVRSKEGKYEKFTLAKPVISVFKPRPVETQQSKLL